jgi:hypothetical protein
MNLKKARQPSFSVQCGQATEVVHLIKLRATLCFGAVHGL